MLNCRSCLREIRVLTGISGPGVSSGQAPYETVRICMLRRSLRGFKLLTQRLLSRDMLQPHGVITGPTSTSRIERGGKVNKKENEQYPLSITLEINKYTSIDLGVSNCYKDGIDCI
jgi:hypothetical protein